MKKHWSLFSLLLLSFLAFLMPGCKKDGGTQQQVTPNPPYATTDLSGTIALPTGSPRDVNTLTILSPVAQGTVSGGRYQVKSIKDEFTTQIAADAAGQPVLMGYGYPGQTDFAINAQSTVLAIMMNRAAVYSLTPQGRQTTIAKIKTDPAFAAATQEVERLLRTNKALFDSTNTVLAISIAALFQNVARRTQFGPDQPVRIDRSGRNLTFTNAGVPFTNTVGIYKDGQKVTQMSVYGQNFVATSLLGIATPVLGSTLPSGFGPTPSAVNYQLNGDGQFDIRIRTGIFGAGATGTEQVTAFANNIAQVALLSIKAICPQFERLDCAAAIGTFALNKALSLQSLSSATTPASATIAIGKVTYATITDGKSVWQNCSPDATVKFTIGMAVLFKWANALVNQLGSAANLGVLIYAWLAYPAAQDTCFRASGTMVGSCGKEYVALKNFWRSTYMQAANGAVVSGAVSMKWAVIPDATNAAHSHLQMGGTYLSVNGAGGLTLAAQRSAATAWLIEPSSCISSNMRIKNVSTGNYIHTEYGPLICNNAPILNTCWHSAMWIIER